MSGQVTLSVDGDAAAGDVAVVVIDNPPVNAIGPEVVDGLSAALDRAQENPTIRAIVVMGAGRTFVAGADIKELEQAAWGGGSGPPDIHDLLARIEDCPKPVVMALHGTPLGGGLELAMAGHFRVASNDTKMGQPEVNLGIIPGAEGTQRLTRLVGVEKAIGMCVSGKPITAVEALAVGLVDRLISGDLRSGALAFARDVAAGVSRGTPLPRTRDRRDKLGTSEVNAPLLAAGRALAKTSRRNMLAPAKVVDAIEAATSLPFLEGVRREREIFFECLRSDQCKALVHAFLAERAVARVPDVPRDTPTSTIGTVTIIGAGTMGSGIATACVNAGLQVVLADVSRDAVERGMGGIRRNLDSAVKRGRTSQEEADRRFGLVREGLEYEGVASADLVIEAVFENLALKKQVFAAIDAVARPGSILATNTSTLSIDEIASATKRPESVIGMHFFSPAHIMRLVEIVRGRATGTSTIATALALAKRLNKVGVVVRNGPGFVGNRMMFPYMYEAQFLVEDGATPEQVDRVLTDWGMAMGIFAVDDMGGLDVAWRVRQELHQFEEPGARKPVVADTLVEMGRLGQKTGQGWYRYGEDRKPIPDPEVVALIERAANAAGIARRPIGDEEIRERTIYAMINEGARVLEDNIASRAADIDVIYLTGYGFPAYRGGPMMCADQIGLAKILERVEAFHRELGPRWAPAPLLARLARAGSTFRELDAQRG
jgi:3-hydroxyacyl-CoA dehydrogenase